MKNWKTTAVGLITAIATHVLDVVQTGNLSVKTIILAAGFAALGYFSKDADETNAK